MKRLSGPSTPRIPSRRAALAAVNLGLEADTTGALFGQIAGAFYGAEAIPKPWLAQLAKRNLIESLAADLLRGSGL